MLIFIFNFFSLPFKKNAVDLSRV